MVRGKIEAIVAIFVVSVSPLSSLYGAGETFNFVIPWDDDTETAISLKNLVPPNAGSDGFVFVDSNHHLSTAAGRIKFWGVSLCYGANFPTHADSEKIARHMAKYGINLVRFHDMDATDIWVTTDPDRVLDPGKLDKLDYLIYQLKANGIYSDINLLVNRPFSRGTELHPDINLIEHSKVRAVLGFFDPANVALQKQYASDLLTHVNPYTGVAYINEPAVALIEINNENGLVQAFLSDHIDDLPPYYDGLLNARWNTWLATKYGDHAALVAAWAISEPPGPGMLANGDFASGVISPWYAESHYTATVNASVDIGAGPGGVNAARLDITSTGYAGWHVQFNQGGLNVVSDAPYSISFYAKADTAGTISVDVGMGHEPWESLGFYAPLDLTTSWQEFTFIFPLHTADTNARLNFSEMGLQTGTVWFTGISMKRGGSLGLYPGEDLDAGTIRNFKLRSDHSRSNDGKRDWFRFLTETEENYWLEMKDYIENTLHAQSPVIGTILGYSNPNVQANFEVTDTHAYWQHPEFLSTPWDPVDWYVDNQAMVNHPGDSAMRFLSMKNILNRPHVVSEYNHSHPNTFQAEAFLFLSAYASLQDWDAVIPFAYNGMWDDWNVQRTRDFFDFDQNPVKLASFIPAAMAFLRGDIRPANQTVVVPIDRVREIDELLTAYPWILVDASKVGEDPKAGLIHKVEIAVEGQSIPPGSLEPGTTDVSGDIFTSDTGEIVWNTSIPGQGVLTVDTDMTKMVVGYGGSRTFDLSGVMITPGTTLQNGFGVITLNAVDGVSVTTATKLVVTALGATENTNTTWYQYPDTIISFPPAEGLNITLKDDWGNAPSMVEGIPATIVLPTDPSDTRVWALDNTGARGTELTVTDNGGLAEFSIGPSYNAVWYEIEVIGTPAPTPTSTNTSTSTATNTPTGPTRTPTITGIPTITPTITNTPTITRTPTVTPTGGRKLAIMKKESVNDTNLYYYRSLGIGDWNYGDAFSRNPSALARDLWVVPAGNDAIGMAAAGGGGPDTLFVLKREGGGDVNLYLYNGLVDGDWTYWDALARNPSALARDLWVVSAGNDAISIAAADITGDNREELAILKKEGVNDLNLYYYNAIETGDWTYWDCLARNPSALARDLWMIPGGNDAVGLAAIDMGGAEEKELAIIRKEGASDLNLYCYNNLAAGDWTFWDAVSRNPSPLARDLWIVPFGNDAAGAAALDVDSDGRDELAVLKKEGAGDVNIYYYRSPGIGDWTFWDAVARNPSPLSRDLWAVPSGNDAVDITAIRTD